MTIFLLTVTAALVATAAVLMFESFRRRDSMRSLLAMTITMAAAVPAAAYALITA